ncbi:hypothetical protein J7399_11045 [Shimia sp. R9_1]|uniref:hypothetical protein n=1 Tax=unclassified Shimia TaxID=2630038 RepID=UPI001ADC2E18|nr:MULTISPECIES: hypothetical protein [unclassified Shimia]MBO9397219.1 hypothetical protein [Shimia sp. R9_2]MBO9401840.1 hypothetical protein [Shimia sp. R9_3]MBO9407967.1 hypothetical protein [Shimia sp. R9_1]
MSDRPNIPFLERQSYRRRRLIDTVRMVPVVGAVLWAVPLLWPTPEDGAGSVASSDAIIYIFLVWFALVLLGAWFAFLMKRSDAQEEGGGR